MGQNDKGMGEKNPYKIDSIDLVELMCLNCRGKRDKIEGYGGEGMKIEGILFDLDGTLLDTLEDLTDSVNVTLQAHGFPLRRKEEIRRFLGNGSEALLRAALPKGTEASVFAACLAEYQAYYQAHMEEKTAPYAEILPLLERLRENGLRLGVVSNKFDTAVKGLCEKYFAGRIDAAAGEREAEGIRRKPAPDMVLTAAKRLGVRPERCLYIGDSEVDIQTAKNAGRECISVCWGFRDEAFLKQAGASRLVHSPRELLQLILEEKDA